MKKLHVVLRTCDRKSIESNRIVDKKECIIRCFNSLVKALEKSPIEKTLHVIDDGSSQDTINELKKICNWATFDLVPYEDDLTLNPKQKSRKTVKIAYEYIDTLPQDDLVYIVEDDYLHYLDSIEIMLNAWDYFTDYIKKDIVIFPHDFNQLYAHPQNLFNDTYVTQCYVLPGPERYWRSTWFTHESFMCPISLINRYRAIFDNLLIIGTEEGAWEGNTISNVWERPEVMVMMPIGSLIIHLGNEKDISFFIKDWKALWEENKTS